MLTRRSWRGSFDELAILSVVEIQCYLHSTVSSFSPIVHKKKDTLIVNIF